MSTPFMGEIKLFAFAFAPAGWAICSGQLLPINQYEALFSILSTTYGGDGARTFALPNLSGRTPVHSVATLGEAGGSFNGTVALANLPAHTHPAYGDAGGADAATPAGALLGNRGTTPDYFATNGAPAGTMHPSMIGNNDGGQPFSTAQPSLVLTFAIALQGMYPPSG